jgi:antirestriction protein ArdC
MNQSLANYPAIIAGFSERGISDIRPRENVFTFAAWQALGRYVRKGEKGVKIQTWITVEKNGERVTVPKTTTVFHISQTEPK